MARGRSVQATIDVAYVSAGTLIPVDDGNLFTAAGSPAPGGFGVTGLQAALADQGIAAATSTMIDASAPAAARAGLAAALRGPDRTGSLAEAGPPPAIALLDADLLLNAPALGAVLDDPRVHTGALSVLEDGRQVHLGVLKLDGEDRAAAADLVERFPALPTRPAELLLALTRALTDSGIAVQSVPLGSYAWARPADRAQAAIATEAIAAVDERTVRLREAARGGDGFYSSFVLRRLSWRLTGVAERTGLTPNEVTLISFGLGLLAACFLALGSRPWAVLGALLLQFCLVVDCVDGELARYRRRFSRFGAWLDATTDRIKEFATIAALAVGAARHGGDLWWLVAAAIALQTFRNLVDLGWSLQRAAVREPDSDPGSALAPADHVDWVASATSFRAPSSERTGPGALSWIRRIGHFPIGERFLLISLGAALWSPRATLIALLVAGLLSAGYMLAAFAVRSRSSNLTEQRIAGLIDAGPLLGAVIRQAGRDRAGRLAALLPALIAVAELALIWWLCAEVAGADDGAAVVLVAVTAIAHYQQAYGVREGEAETGTFVVGTDLRLVAVLLVVVLPAALLSEPDAGAWASAAVWGLAVLVAVSSMSRSLRAWTDPSGRSRHAGGMKSDDTENQHTVLREAMGGVR